MYAGHLSFQSLLGHTLLIMLVLYYSKRSQVDYAFLEYENKLFPTGWKLEDSRCK